jgi:hypothetical protein
MMVNRVILGAICVWSLAVAPAVAQVPVTLVLRSGERISGSLVDLNAGGFSMQVEGKPRTVRPPDVAYVQFVDPGTLSGDAPRKLAAGQPFAVLREGGTADGRLVDVGGRVPLRLTLEGPSGATRDLSSAEVAVVYLARPSRAGRQPQAPSGEATAVPVTPGQKVFTVPGSRAWTSTLLTFEGGDVVGFRATGQIRLSPGAGDVVPPAGVAGTKPGSNFPMPAAPRGALVGRIDDGPAFMIGARQSMRIPGNGVLHLGVNDDLTSDNGGAFQVTVSILPRRR